MESSSPKKALVNIKKQDKLNLVGMDASRMKVQKSKVSHIVKQLNVYEICQRRNNEGVSTVLNRDPNLLYLKQVD